MKNNNETKNSYAGLLFMAFLAITAPIGLFAIDLPAIAVAYGEIVEGLIVKVLVGIVVLVMLISSGWQMYENGNARPFKWAIGGSLVMGGAVFFGESMIDYAANALNGFTGASAKTTVL